MGLESLLGGFAKGFGQGLYLKDQREREKERAKLQSEYLKAQTKMMDWKLAEEKRTATKEGIVWNSPKFQQFIGMNPGAGEARKPSEAYVKPAGSETQTQFGESFMPGKTGATGGIADILAIAQMNPMIAEILEKYTDIDFGGAISTGIRQADFMRRGEETKTFTWKDPYTGREQTVEYPKYGPIAKGHMVSTGPEPLEPYTFVKDGKTFEGIRNSVTKQPMPVTPIPKEAPKAPAAETAGKVRSLIGTRTRVSKMRQLLFDEMGSPKKTVLVSASVGGGVGPGREFISNFREAIDGVVRAMTGAAVRDEEWPFYEAQFLPSLMDLTQPGLAADKLNRLEAWAEGYVNIMDPTGELRKRAGGNAPPGQTKGKPKQGITETPLPPDEALMQLKEGFITEFDNGQKWTLENGKPKRIP